VAQEILPTGLGARSMNKDHLWGQSESYPRVSKKIAEHDGMLNREGDPQAKRYFWVGASGLCAIRECLGVAGIDEKSVKRILDYACGYGRVLRWIKAQFPIADIIGVDADPKAAAAAMRVTGVRTEKLDTALTFPIGTEKFDVI
jgi:SAM-dependent methyltransferase